MELKNLHDALVACFMRTIQGSRAHSNIVPSTSSVHLTYTWAPGLGLGKVRPGQDRFADLQLAFEGGPVEAGQAAIDVLFVHLQEVRSAQQLYSHLLEITSDCPAQHGTAAFRVVEAWDLRQLQQLQGLALLFAEDGDEERTWMRRLHGLLRIQGRGVSGTALALGLFCHFLHCCLPSLYHFNCDSCSTERFQLDSRLSQLFFGILCGCLDLLHLLFHLCVHSLGHTAQLL
mmetsp:Transcript_75786/g.122383  ORF Transcript_75786/g.122383 Transcript_75786/m.122383 type:complete len:231 (-) Transcript_75786:371-1063(-)